MHIIIIGCGRVGARLASLLSSSGNSVVVIDKNPASFEKLEPSFKGKTIEGVGFDRKTLLEAGIESADALAAVTNGDNSNVVVASIAAQDFHVPRVVARINDPVRAEIFPKLGITTVSSTLWTSGRIFEYLISPELHNVYSVGSAGVQIYEFEVQTTLVGRNVRDIEVPNEIRVVAITREGVGFVPVLGTVFKRRDHILVAVDTRSIDKLKAMLGLSS
jgi:trk system potassium uptake protein TrkA